MSENYYLTILSPIVGIIFTIFLFSLWIHNRARGYIAVLAAAFVFYTLASSSRVIFVPSNSNSYGLVTVALYFVCIALVIQGCLKRKNKELSYGYAIIVAAGTLLANSYYLFVEPSLATRVYILSFGMGLLTAAGAYRLRPVQGSRFVDKFIFLLFVLLSVQLFVRPMLLVSLGDTDLRAFGESAFWVAMHFSLIVSAMLMGLTVFFAIMTDITMDLKKESATDVLTGVYNRRGFDEKAAAVIESGKHHPVSLVVCDIDHFKSINDRHGHPAGDRVIERLSALLTAHVRKADIVARIGGEEFAVLLTECTPNGARSFSERVRVLFEVPGIEALPGLSKTTASFGIASHRPGESLQELINRADRLLYKAKKAGRNRICSDEDNLDLLATA